MTASFESVSTWRQPLPKTTSPQRRQLIESLADAVHALSPRRLRIAVDGRTAAGKTTFGHELAAALRGRGRPTARASLDDFKHPWSHAREHGYDRESGEGYYRNAYDFTSATHLLLQPAGPSGSGRVVLCAHDPLTGVDHRDTIAQLPNDTVLIVDSVFAFRPQYAPFWDYRIWLEIDPDLALRRGITRDSAREGVDGAVRLHRDRYGLADCDPPAAPVADTESASGRHPGENWSHERQRRVAGDLRGLHVLHRRRRGSGLDRTATTADTTHYRRARLVTTCAG